MLSLSSTTSAHSPAWPSIAYSETIQSLHHDILPRSLLSSSSSHISVLSKRSERAPSKAINIVQRGDRVRLEFSAFNSTFFLHLEPNNDLVHPNLDLSGHEDLSSVQDIKAFKGFVVQDEDTSLRKWNRDLTTSAAEGASHTYEHRLYEEGVLGWARMMIEHDANSDKMVLRGAFTDGSTTYHVTSRQHYHVQKRSDDHSPSSSAPADGELVIYRDSDIFKHKLKQGDHDEPLSTCGSTGPSYASPEQHHGYYYPPDLTAPVPMGGAGSVFEMGMPFRKRDDVTVKVAGPNPVPTGCPASRMVNYMGVAADCVYVRSYGGLENARKQILADFNTASAIYESTFNVALGLNALQIESMNCPTIPVQDTFWNQECTNNYTITDRLSDFSYWRGQDGRSTDGNGLWHLVTGCNSGSIIGIAWTQALCQTTAIAQGSQYTAGVAVSSISPNSWMVVAHEVGHGFGANHDCTASTCVSAAAIQAAACCPLSGTQCNAGDHYIMNPAEQTATSIFSPCSINAICSNIGSPSGSCLQPAGAKVTQSLSLNVCGNGIKEAGEQCDCGSPDECAKDPCCDGTTCTFKGNAVCDDLNDDCCNNCQLAPAGMVCRSAISDCDIAETCSGNSTTCPPDVRIPNLTSCQILAVGANNRTVVQGQGQCANGICTSRDLQCAQQDRPGITGQCTAMKSGCAMLCNDPSGAANSCMQIPGVNFVDGSPCGNSNEGMCVNGDCVLPGGWARNNLQILIPVICAIVVICGGGVGLGIFCHRRMAKKRVLLGKIKEQSLGLPEPSTGKDGKEGADVPRWMVTENRRQSATGLSTSAATLMSRRPSSSQAISRRTSLSAQHILGQEDDAGTSQGIDLSNTSAAQQQLYYQYCQAQAQAQGQTAGETQEPVLVPPQNVHAYPYTYMTQHRLEHEHNSPFLYQLESPPLPGLQSPAPAYSPFGGEGQAGRFPDAEYHSDQQNRPGHPQSQQ
ncbi:hypothetical protein EMPS_03960 [Entomortierella parvispora]|uniref:Uncharacterized protein n=1 Tax=Entomortierella parvispora TaxID=205924 RepID=A0A9P3H7P3_9FUNG|nr:hypothetical protein EMPS_03960 [Entomortierella parvispora]